MKDNNDKKDLLLRCIEPSTMVIDGSPIESNVKEMLPGTTTDSKLKFDNHDNNICKRVCQIFNVLACLETFIKINERRIIMKTLIESQFRYFPLV